MPIEGHMENTAKVLKNVKSRAQDANIKIAVENHAGDMQGRELRQLIEAAGKEDLELSYDPPSQALIVTAPTAVQAKVEEALGKLRAVEAAAREKLSGVVR